MPEWVIIDYNLRMHGIARLNLNFLDDVQNDETRASITTACQPLSPDTRLPADPIHSTESVKQGCPKAIAAVPDHVRGHQTEFEISGCVPQI
jgi:hypothetical protein